MALVAQTQAGSVFPTSVPAALTLSSQHLTRGVPIFRQHLEIRAEKNTYASTTLEEIKIVVPNVGAIDPRSLALKMRVKLFTAGDANLAAYNGASAADVYCVENYIGSLFSKFELHVGSTIVEAIEHFGLWANMQLPKLMAEEDAVSVGYMLMGMGQALPTEYAKASQTTQDAMPSRALLSHTDVANGRTYIIPLLSSILSRDMCFPVSLLKQPVRVVLDMASPEDCTYTNASAGAPIYRIYDPVLMMDMIRPSKPLLTQWKKTLASGSIVWRFSQWHHFQEEALSAKNTTVKLFHYANSVKRIMFCIRDTTATLDHDVVNKLTAYHSGGLDSFQLRVNGVKVPHNAVETTRADHAGDGGYGPGPALYHYMRSNALWPPFRGGRYNWAYSRAGKGVQATGDGSGAFMGFQSFQNPMAWDDNSTESNNPEEAPPGGARVYELSLEDHPNFAGISGMDTANIHGSLELLLNFNSAPSNKRLDVFVESDGIFEIQPRGTIRVHR